MIAAEFINSILSNDETLAGIVGTCIYNTIADIKAGSPYIIFNVQAPGKDTVVLGGFRLASNPVFQVKAVGKDVVFEDLNAIANQIDILLHNAAGTTSDGRVFSIIRDAPIQYVEPAKDGGYFYHLGGLYKVVVQAN